MLDRHDAQEGQNEAGQNRAPRNNPAERPLADREVPLPGSSPAMADAAVAIHQWLDGETTEAVARRADARQVDLWNKINDDTERLRRMTTPAYVPQRIMAALPQKAPEPATSFLARPLAISPATAFLAAAGLVALGILIAKFTLR
jgi:hypothetical protein